MTPDRIPISIPLRPFVLAGTLVSPQPLRGVVLLADGSGSSRAGLPDRAVGEVLVAAGTGALFVDLLTAEEERTTHARRTMRRDVELLAGRLAVATDWVRADPATARLPLGYFGHGTGVAVALIAASERPGVVDAVVGVGGRADLAGAALAGVRAPTLLIVAGEDRPGIEANRQALASVPAASTRLHVVGGARRLLDEPRASAEVARLAGDWFDRFLRSGAVF